MVSMKFLRNGRMPFKKAIWPPLLVVASIRLWFSLATPSGMAGGREEGREGGREKGGRREGRSLAQCTTIHHDL